MGETWFPYMVLTCNKNVSDIAGIKKRVSGRPPVKWIIRSDAWLFCPGHLLREQDVRDIDREIA